MQPSDARNIPADLAVAVADVPSAHDAARADIEAPGASPVPLWRRLPLRSGLAASIGIHAVILLFAFGHVAEPFEAMPEEAISVDIVPSSEVPSSEVATPASEPSGADPKVGQPTLGLASPSFESLATTGWIPPPQRPQQTPQAQQPPQPPPSGDTLARMLHVELLPTGGSDAPPSESKMDASDAVAVFKTHLQSCWVRPSAGGDARNLKIVIRVALDRNGKIRGEPSPIEIKGAGSAMGPAVMASAMRALRQCEPYSLPADKYEDWKVIDLRFTPAGVS